MNLSVRHLGTLLILGILEVSFSFDNAVVNAKVLERLSPKWQAVFMTVGIAIAVFGMRFLFPILVVVFTTNLSFGGVLNLALHHPAAYNVHLTAAHGQVAMFGGTFLLMIFLDFILEERDVTWLPFENVLAKAGKLDMLSVVVALGAVIGISQSVHNSGSLLLSGVSSLVLYLLVNMLANVFEDEDEEADEAAGASVKGRVGWGAFFLFLYLEVQDAAFSFDGVSGAFAITSQVVLIAAGLCIGALFVRSMTIHLLRSGKLAELRYLDHGAHWAIGVLAVCLLTTTKVDIPNYVTGLIGVVLIAAAVIGSIRANRREAQLEAAVRGDNSSVRV